MRADSVRACALLNVLMRRNNVDFINRVRRFAIEFLVNENAEFKLGEICDSQSSEAHTKTICAIVHLLSVWASSSVDDEHTSALTDVLIRSTIGQDRLYSSLLTGQNDDRLLRKLVSAQLSRRRAQDAESSSHSHQTTLWYKGDLRDEALWKDLYLFCVDGHHHFLESIIVSENYYVRCF